jgi:hypothetical protein
MYYTLCTFSDPRTTSNSLPHDGELGDTGATKASFQDCRSGEDMMDLDLGNLPRACGKLSTRMVFACPDHGEFPG